MLFALYPKGPTKMDGGLVRNLVVYKEVMKINASSSLFPPRLGSSLEMARNSRKSQPRVALSPLNIRFSSLLFIEFGRKKEDARNQVLKYTPLLI